jgi:hypothetical protein
LLIIDCRSVFLSFVHCSVCTSTYASDCNDGIFTHYIYKTSAVLMHGHAGQLDFVGSTNTIYICLILSTIYIFISVSGCVGMEPSALSGVYCAVKTALYITPSLFVRVVPASNKKTTSMLSTLSLQYCYFKCVLSLSLASVSMLSIYYFL